MIVEFSDEQKAQIKAYVYGKQELAQKILSLIEEAYARADGRDESYRVGCYALALGDIEKLCKELVK